MTTQEKEAKVTEAIKSLGLEERGVFCNYEEAYPSMGVKAGFWVGTEEQDDGEKFPPDTPVEKMIAFVKEAYA